MADKEDIRARLQRIKQNIYSEMSDAVDCRDIIKSAIKIRFPGIPERANDNLVSKLMDLDDNEILQMGKDTIKVSELIDDIVLIIAKLMNELDNENFYYD